VYLLPSSEMSEKLPSESRFLKFIFLYTVLVVLYKKSVVLVQVLWNFTAWTHCQDHTSFIMKECSVICKFTEELREVNCFVVTEWSGYACGMSGIVMTVNCTRFKQSSCTYCFNVLSLQCSWKLLLSSF
jgi:hypothetical protein